MSKPPPIYQLKITLLDTKPPIWRRILVRADTSLAQLHDIIQVVMDWDDAHLHLFTVAGQQYSLPYDPTHLAELGAKDSRRATLAKLVTGEPFQFTYDYDFGDDWRHHIIVEKILPPDPKQALPVCLAGKRACPPEDVGGVWGYEDFLKALKDPDHPEHAMYAEWIGGTFDPDVFDVDAANERLKLL